VPPDPPPATFIPRTLRCLFPLYPTPAATAARFTAIDTVVNADGVAGTVEMLYVGDHFDTAGTKTYTESLAAIAAERAALYAARMGIEPNFWTFIGGYPVVPGNTIRRVRWTMDGEGPGRGWRTQVWQHGLVDAPREDFQPRMGFMSVPGFNIENELPGMACLPRDDGTMDHQVDASLPTLVKVTKDGGVSGDAATECTWTYTVKDLAGNTLGTTMTPQVPRLHFTAYWYAGETRTLPNVATSIYGLAAMDGGTTLLLQCFGEIGKDDACP
jgi:hypothetical protein